MENFWSTCLSRFEQELSKQQYNTWIKPLVAEVNGNVLRLVAPNRFVLQWVKDRFNKNIEQFARELHLDNIQIDFVIANIEADQEDKATEKLSAKIQTELTKMAINPLDVKFASKKTVEATKVVSGLNSAFNFDNYVSGRANQLARAAAIQVAENPGAAYNPLFIYGGVGLGKTHLLHAIGNELKKHIPDAKIRYLHAERYVSDVVKAYENKAFDEFKRQYHSLDLLLIDDIQFFAKKTRTQEEFFYAFNSLIETKKQIIITCDTYPKEIMDVDERLRTRFSWGLTVAVEPPELEMRVAILLKKAEAVNLNLPEEVAFFIAKQIRSSVRELEGALNRIIAMAKFTGHAIDVHLAKDALRDLIAVRGRQVTMENIQKTVADYYKIKVADMYSKKRPANIARPRQIAMYLAKELTQKSLPEIGDLFGGRDHTTVLHAVRKIGAERLQLTEVNQQLHVLEQTLKG